MITVNDLHVKIGKNEIIHGISFDVGDKEKVAIIGPNGSGKTTIIKTLLGILKYEGSIIINENELSHLTRKELAKIFSYVPQSFSTPYTFTVEEFVSMGRYINIRNWWEAHDIDPFLDEIDISNLRHRLINTLSGGELQKALIARALAQQADVILLDEPTSHLDPKSSFEIYNIIEKLNKSIIAAVHDVNAANRFFDRIILLDRGVIYGIYNPNSSDFIEAISKIYSINFKNIDGNIIPYQKSK